MRVKSLLLDGQTFSFSPEMECEEADWTVGRCTASLEPVSVPMDAPFALYKHMHL